MSETRHPEVSIIVPCYNHAQYLDECLTSLVSQTYPHWKALVVDDASPDYELVAPIIAKIGDPRIALVRHDRNRGLSASRNTGIRESAGELFVCVDADDQLAPSYLERLVPRIWNDDTVDCIFAQLQLFGRRDDVVTFRLPGPGEKVLRWDRTIPGPGTLMRRRLWLRVGGYDESETLRHGREDLEFWVRAFSSGCKAASVAEPLYRYRVSHTSMSSACRLHDHAVARYIYEKHRDLFDSTGEGRRFLSLGFSYSASAWHTKGSRLQALWFAFRAWRLNPSREGFRSILRTTLSPRLLYNMRRGEITRRIPFLGYPLNGKQRHRPFFIIGVARSGNTLLRRVLNAHSELHIPPETFVLGECIKEFGRYRRVMNWEDLVHLMLSRFEFHPEFHTFDISLRPLANQLLDVPGSKRNLALILDSFYRYHARQQGRSSIRWGDKSPLNSLAPGTLEAILKVFPDAQFLHIYRDGCDVVYSHLRGGFYRDLTEAAHRWLLVIRQTRRFVQRHPAQCFEIRYEDLLAQPEATLRAVCQFLKIDYEPRMLTSENRTEQLGDVPRWFWHKQVREPINASNVGKGRNYFTIQEKETLQRLIGSELESLGYPPVETEITVARSQPEASWEV